MANVLVTGGLGVRVLRAEMLPDVAKALELGGLTCRLLPLTELGPEGVRPLGDAERSRVGVETPLAKWFDVLGARGVSELPMGRELGGVGRELGFSGVSPPVKDDWRAGGLGRERGGTDEVSETAPSGAEGDVPFGIGV